MGDVGERVITDVREKYIYQTILSEVRLQKYIKYHLTILSKGYSLIYFRHLMTEFSITYIGHD